MQVRKRGMPLSAAIAVTVMAGVAPVVAAARGAEPASQEPPPVVFEGFGLDGFDGADSIAFALRESDIAADEPAGPPLGVVVRGPTGRDAALNPLAAEIRSRIEGLDVMAGMLADQSGVRTGPSQWISAVGVASDHALGRDVLELRTSLGQRQETSVIMLEMGPRIERRLPGGISVFLDGKAQAQSLRSPETGEWSYPGTATEAMGMIGISARTGLAR
jgi:hypothetical protein